MEDLFPLRWDVGFLTVRIHVLSVPRSLPPEGNHRLGFGLIVQRLHAAGSIGTAETKQKENYKNNQKILRAVQAVTA